MSGKFEGKTYYEILRVPKDASKRDIREAYKEIARVYHPDSNFYGEIVDYNPSAEELESFKIITQAYNTLIDKTKRAEYDKNLPPDLRGWDDDFRDQKGEEDSSDREGSATYRRFGQLDAEEEAPRNIQEKMTSLHQKVQEAGGQNWKDGHKKILTSVRGVNAASQDEANEVSEEKTSLWEEDSPEGKPRVSYERYMGAIYLLLGLAIGLFIMFIGIES